MMKVASTKVGVVMKRNGWIRDLFYHCNRQDLVMDEMKKGKIKGFLDLNKPFSGGFIYGGGED